LSSTAGAAACRFLGARRPTSTAFIRCRRPLRAANEGGRSTDDIDQHAEYQYASQVPPEPESSVKDVHDMPGHLARRFQQIAVAVFLAAVEEAGYDLTPVQYAALAAVSANHGIDQVTLAGLIAYDRTTITGVVDRLVQKGLVARHESSRDRRAREPYAASRRRSRRLSGSCCAA